VCTTRRASAQTAAHPLTGHARRGVPMNVKVKEIRLRLRGVLYRLCDTNLKKKKLTFLVQGARRRRPDAVINVGRRRLFAENIFLGSKKKYFVDKI
jgi:hypothetical protein